MSRSVWRQWMLVVHDVPRSSRFYCNAVGLESAHGGNEYEQLYHDGELGMQLHHARVDDHHGALWDPDVPLGNEVLVWSEVADLDAAGCVSSTHLIDGDGTRPSAARQA